MQNLSVEEINQPKEFSILKDSGWKFYILLFVAFVGFACFTFFNYSNASENKRRLNEIESISFPILQRIDVMNFNHAKMGELLKLQTPMPDPFVIEEAEQLLEQNIKLSDEIKKLDPSLSDEINNIIEIQKEYFLLAEQNNDDQLKNIVSISAKKERLNSQASLYLKELRERRYSQFNNMIKESSEKASVLIFFGILVVLINLAVMIVLTILGKNNAKMMKIIQINNENLERNIANRTMELNKKTIDIQAILHNMKQGVFTFSSEFKIHEEYSSYLEIICGETDLSGKNIFDVLFNKSDLGIDKKDQLENALKCSFNEPPEQFDWNSHLLVDEILFRNNSESRHVKLDWIRIVDQDGLVEKIMVIARDVTELRKLNAESEAQKRELKMLGEIIDASSSQFISFVSSARNYLARNLKLIQSKGRDREILNSLFINMHTIKGNSRTQGFSYITDVVHKAEKYYDFLRKNDHQAWDIGRLQSDIQNVETAINEYDKLFKDKLAKMNEKDAKSSFFEEVKESLESILDLGDDFQSEYVNHLSYFVMATEAVSINDMIRPLQKSCASIAQELGKYVPSWNVIGGDLLLRPEVVSLLGDALVHCVRNSMDYGIGMPDERQARHKDPAGKISVIAKEENEKFLLEFFDDGDGLNLVDLEKIGRARGVLIVSNPSDEKIAGVMFHNGVSTKQGEATDISGRGVGMSAAFDLLEQIGGTMRVEFIAPRVGNYRQFKLVVEIYADNCLVNPVHLVDFGKNFSKAS